MRRMVWVVTAACMVLVFVGSLCAETEITVSGQVRVRAETSDKHFWPDFAAQNYRDLRTRLRFEAIVDSNTHAVIQLQDSRRFGENDASGTTNDLKNVDMHQAYIQIDRLVYEGAGGKVGRFEVNLGNQRLFGSVGWHNVGRSWEGGMAWYGTGQFKITGMSLKLDEVNNPYGNADFDIYGLYINLPKAGWDVFGFYEYDASGASVDGEWVNRVDRITVGSYFKRSFSGLDIEGNFAYQFGQKVFTDYGDYQKPDLSAFLVTAEVGYTFPGKANARIAGGIDYTSGDDDLSDDTYKAFDNLYYTGHKFRGYMDYFIESDEAGLMDLMFRGRIDPAPEWTVAADVHYFKTAQEYLGFGPEMTQDVGMEVDITISTTTVKGVVFDGGISAFLPSESFARWTDPDPGIWSFGTFTVNF